MIQPQVLHFSFYIPGEQDKSNIPVPVDPPRKKTAVTAGAVGMLNTTGSTVLSPEAKLLHRVTVGSRGAYYHNRYLRTAMNNTDKSLGHTRSRSATLTVPPDLWQSKGTSSLRYTTALDDTSLDSSEPVNEAPDTVETGPHVGFAQDDLELLRSGSASNSDSNAGTSAGPMMARSTPTSPVITRTSTLVDIPDMFLPHSINGKRKLSELSDPPLWLADNNYTDNQRRELPCKSVQNSMDDMSISNSTSPVPSVYGDVDMMRTIDEEEGEMSDDERSSISGNSENSNNSTSGRHAEDEDEIRLPASSHIKHQQTQIMLRHRQRHPDYIYQAPCEHYPSQDQTGYLVNDRCRRYDNLLSVIEFGVRASDCLPVTFKTVADAYLAGRELAALTRVEGVPNVINMIDTFLDDLSRRVFILPRLRPLLWTDRDLKEMARFFQQLITALNGVHKCGIVHLDVNPANIMLDLNGDLVLIDFGLAQYVPTHGPQAGCSTSIRPCGTPGFIAPELLRASYAPRDRCYSTHHESSYSDLYESLDERAYSHQSSYAHSSHSDDSQKEVLHDGRACDMYSAGVVFALALLPYLPDECSSVRCLGSAMATQDTLLRAREELINAINNPFRDTTIPEVVWQAMEVAAGLLDPEPSTRWTAEDVLSSSFL
jgi:hypothetical protein